MAALSTQYSSVVIVIGLVKSSKAISVSVMNLVSSSLVSRTLTNMQTLMGFETILPCVSVIHLVISSVILPQCWDNG